MHRSTVGCLVGSLRGPPTLSCDQLRHRGRANEQVDFESFFNSVCKANNANQHGEQKINVSLRVAVVWHKATPRSNSREILCDEGNLERFVLLLFLIVLAPLIVVVIGTVIAESDDIVVVEGDFQEMERRV
jgi:hypothetical protein